MNREAPADVVQALAALPCGSVRGKAAGRRWIASKTEFNSGRSVKLVAEELGGSGYVSLNLYALRQGAQLYPCEMSAQKVIAFLRSFRPETAPRTGP